LVNRNPSKYTWTARLNPSVVGVPTREYLDEGGAPPGWYDKSKEISKLIMETFLGKGKIYEQHVNQLNTIAELPSTFDASEKWPECADGIRLVRNQGGCGSCWAISSTSMMTDRICIRSRGQRKPDISLQHLLECCDYCGRCHGGNVMFALYFWFEQGIYDDRCYPYTIDQSCGHPCRPATFDVAKGLGRCSRTCKRRDPHVRPSNRRYRAQYFYDFNDLEDTSQLTSWGLTNRDASFEEVLDLVKRDVFFHGSAVVCFVVFQDFFHYYDGVYNVNREDNFGSNRYTHCVKVIGWGRYGEDREYLTIVNSWGGPWAKDGTVKIDTATLWRLNASFFGAIPDDF
jgi:cathepsin B